MRYVTLVLVLLLAGGCNLFSPFHDEGNSDSLDDIIGDVQAALERGEPDKAYDYAVDGIDKHPESVTLHYLAAVARVQDAKIGFTDFASMLRSGDGDGSALLVLHATGPAEGDTTFFLDLSPEVLASMAGAFNTTYELLEAAVQLIEEGAATPQELDDFLGDINLGLGISGLLKAILTVLDTDHDLENGFVLSSVIRAFEYEDQWGDTHWGFSAVVVPSVVCGAMPYLRVGEEALYDHYRYVAGGSLPENIPAVYLNLRVEDWSSPRIDEDLLTGEIFAAVHDGIVDFYTVYSCGD
jgi:hypothetical protein